jgi:hypothetical protein
MQEAITFKEFWNLAAAEYDSNMGRFPDGAELPLQSPEKLAEWPAIHNRCLQRFRHNKFTVETLYRLRLFVLEQRGEAAWTLSLSDVAELLKEQPNPPANPNPTLDPVSKHGKPILAALLKHYPTLQTIDEIYSEVKGKVSERTIAPELNKLIDAKLAHRPHGQKKGATLTPAGKTLAERLSMK